MKMKDGGLASLSMIQVIVIVVVMTFSIRSSNNVLQTTLPLLSKYNFFYSEFDVGILIALMSLCSVITMIINGKMRGKSRRYMFIASNVIYTFAFFLFAFSGSLSILLYTVLSGTAYGFVFPNIMTSAGLFSDKKIREKVLGIYSLTLSVSLIGGPALESLILTYFSLRTVFILFAPLVVLGAAVSPFLKFPIETMTRQRVTLWDKPGFRLAIYTFLVYSMPTAFLLAFGGIFARSDFGASYASITLLFALFFAASFATRLLFSVLTIGKLWPYVVTMMAFSITGLGLMFVSPNLLVFSVALVLLGIPHGLGMPIALFAIGRSFEVSQRNKANSSFTSVMMLMNVAMPLVGGGLLNFAGFRFIMLYIIPVVVVMLYLTLTLVKSIKISAEQMNKVQGNSGQ